MQNEPLHEPTQEQRQAAIAELRASLKSGGPSAARPTSPDSISDRVRRGELSNVDAMIELGRSFPCVAGHFVHGWDPERIDRVTQLGISTGERHCLLFLLHVWDPNHHWSAGRFDLFAALNNMDGVHRQAMLTFLADPFWP